MFIDDIFVVTEDNDAKFVLKVKNQPETFGIIEKEYNKNHDKFMFSITYYWKKVFQDKLYADDIEEAKDKLKDALTQVINQSQNIKTFSEFKKL